MKDFKLTEWKESSDDSSSPYDWKPEYKKDRPPDRALICSGGSNFVVIDFIGPGLDYLSEEGGDWTYEFGEFEPGVWIMEGHLVTEKYDTPYGTEYDCRFDGEGRPLTEDEWSDLKHSGEGPWDRKEWIEVPEDPEPQFNANAIGPDSDPLELLENVRCFGLDDTDGVGIGLVSNAIDAIQSERARIKKIVDSVPEEFDSDDLIKFLIKMREEVKGE